MKHPAHQYTVRQICNGWQSDNEPWWYGLDDIDELERVAETITSLDAADPDDFPDQLQADLLTLESDYLRTHGNDVYTVQAPDHCVSDLPASGRFNTDHYFTKGERQ